MRTILFRAKHIDDGSVFANEWVYGDLCHYADGTPFIRQQETGTPFEIVPETIGQFTGLKNRNGKDIYEGDILFLGEGDDFKIYNEVGIKDGCFGYIGEINGELIPFCHYNVTEEIVGNIYDNPELLEESEL